MQGVLSIKPFPPAAQLMFSNKDDPESVKSVREAQRAHMRRWIKEAAERNAKRHGRGTGSLSLARL